jgi:putative ABC transport system permease protein
MNVLATVPVALNALRVNALRSLLAMLGVIIGVASVIVMISISDGAKAEVERQISSLGANTLIVRSGSGGWNGRRSGGGTGTPFSDADVEAIALLIPGVVSASGELNTQAAIVADGVNWTSRIQGVNEAYTEIRDWPIENGRMYTAQEVRSQAKVAVLGSAAAEELFGSTEAAVGRDMRIKNVPFQVVGTLVARGESGGGWGGDQDDIVLAPVSTVRSRLAGGSTTVRDAVGQILVALAPGEDAALVQADIEDLMRMRRDVRAGDEDNFSVNNPAEFIRARNETEQQLGLLLAWTGAISLVVGGIGIMNIMLVSVTERTREIGLRMALGARARDVRAQFLTESVTLCLAGGLLGLVAGVAGSTIFAATGDLPVTVNLTVVAVAIASSLFVGVVFGFYPAHRASRLDPIEALRHE